MTSTCTPIAAPVVDWAALAEQVSSGSIAADVLRQKRGDVLTARVLPPGGGDAVIIKLWNRPGIKGFARRLTRTHAPHREWMALNVLSSAGVPVPRPLHYQRLGGPRRAHTDAVVMEDLGKCVRSSEHLAALVRGGAVTEADALSSALVNITAAMIQNGVLDSDHTLMNFLVPAVGAPRRADLELARRVTRPAAHDQLLGAMLGRLVASYIFSVQPLGERVKDFAEALELHTGASRSALSAARVHVDAAVQAAKSRGAVVAAFRLAW